MPYIRHCNNCGNEYTAQRRTSLYCSDKCRVQANRAGIEQTGSDSMSIRFQTFTGTYRVKIFEDVIRVERQSPVGENIAFKAKEFENLYSPLDNIWNINTLGSLLRVYEIEVKK